MSEIDTLIEEKQKRRETYSPELRAFFENTPSYDESFPEQNQTIMIIINNSPDDRIFKLNMSSGDLESRIYVREGAIGKYYELTIVGEKEDAIDEDSELDDEAMMLAIEKYEQGEKVEIFGIKLENGKTVWCLREEFVILHQTALQFCPNCTNLLKRIETNNPFFTGQKIMTVEKLENISLMNDDCFIKHRTANTKGTIIGNLICPGKYSYFLVDHHADTDDKTFVRAAYSSEELRPTQ